MNLVNAGKFPSSFGLVKAPGNVVVESFLAWQKEVLRQYGFELRLEMRQDDLGGALQALLPRTAPITTKYLFWPLNEHWTMYVDNGVNGTNAGPPQVLSSKLGVEAIRVVMADDILDAPNGHTMHYGASILEYYQEGVERRHIFVANDGGKWKFGQAGEPFPFEDMAAYKLKSIKQRFTNTMLRGYLEELGADMGDGSFAGAEHVHGYLLTKHGKMPATCQEFKN